MYLLNRYLQIHNLHFCFVDVLVYINSIIHLYLVYGCNDIPLFYG